MTDLVGIILEDDITDSYELVSYIHVYNVGTNNPAQLVAPYNPSRVKSFISVTDQGVVITQDNPNNTSSSTVAGVAPGGASIVQGTTNNGVDGIEIYGPDPIWAQAPSSIANARVTVINTVKNYA